MLGVEVLGRLAREDDGLLRNDYQKFLNKIKYILTWFEFPD